MIEVGDKAPEFEARMYHPEKEETSEITLKELRGKWVVMTFHPGDFTFVCATDVESFAKKYDEFKENNAEVLAISTDTVFSHKVWSETSPRVQKVQYPMVEDINKNISSAYGFLEEGGMTKRGTVIVDPDGVVQYISVFNDRLGKDVEHVLKSLKGLKHIHENPGDEDE
ncbi:MAG: peroxiredoxin, partial [Candidatus Aenigmatarchaeota archaeon]